jgi:aspartyl/asparaginyl beta-hydroxylase (cupin superfamily)
MNNPATQATQLSRQALAALQKGDAETARSLFTRAASTHDKDASIWLGLAFANAHLGHHEATLAAVDHALELEPYNPRALIFKGDHLTEQKQTRRALVFYQAALKVAARLQPIPADIQKGLQRAQARCAEFSREYEHYLLEHLQKQGYRRGASHPRFEQALDIAFGKREIYYQQPTRFYYPGLPQIEFYQRADFPWLDDIEAATADIRAELQALVAEQDRFSPYLQSDPDAVNFNDTSNLDNADWGACYLYSEGEPVADNAQRCPATMAALARAPLPHVPGSTPHALFSRLAGQTRIPPHHGLINTRLICHLPLVVPPDCGGLRVGSQVQRWQEGEAYVFDDSMEHEAWNDSDRDRIVLLFDIWRPELDEEERDLISALLQGVQAYEEGSD